MGGWLQSYPPIVFKNGGDSLGIRLQTSSLHGASLVSSGLTAGLLRADWQSGRS